MRGRIQQGMLCLRFAFFGLFSVSWRSWASALLPKSMDLSSPSQPVQLVMIWDPIFILFSYLLCVQASYSTVTILQQRFNWWMNCLAAGCFSICGIWAMHFIGMKACDLGVPVVFDGAITMLSMLPAFVLVLIAFALMRTKVTMSDPNATSCEAHLNAMKAAAHHWILLSAILIAAGVCAMHYIGMAAMHIQAVTVSLHWPTIIASAVVAFAASSAAIYFMYILPITMYFPLPTSLVMGLAVCGMHYIGMYGWMPYWAGLLGMSTSEILCEVTKISGGIHTSARIA